MRVLSPVLGGLLLVLCAAPAPAKVAPKGSPKPAPAYLEHKVARGETLWRIAQKHRTSVGAIMDYNRMPDQMVREGSTLRIPLPQAPAPRPRQPIHVVRDGETFWSIADKYRIPPKALAQANPNINPNRIHEDMELFLPVEVRPESPPPSPRPGTAPPAPPPPPRNIIEHMVQPNETYYSIAKKYGVTMEAMVAANPQARPERLRSGMVVAVPMKSAPKGSPSPKPSAPGGTSSARTYKIREGDTMSSIAQRHGISEAALLKENNLKADDPFYVDDVLKIPGSGSSSGARTTSTTPARKTPAPAPTSANRDKYIPSYTVSAGESVTSISEAFGITPKQLLDMNRLPSNARLKAGDEIMIPKSGRR